MSGLVSVMWFLIGIIFAIAGKPFIEVCACFLLYGVCSGAWELYLIRKEFENVDKDSE